MSADIRSIIDRINRYRELYMAYLLAKKMFPELNHVGTEPPTFGLSEWRAEKIRKDCENDLYRKVA